MWEYDNLIGRRRTHIILFSSNLTDWWRTAINPFFPSIVTGRRGTAIDTIFPAIWLTDGWLLSISLLLFSNLTGRRRTATNRFSPSNLTSRRRIYVHTFMSTIWHWLQCAIHAACLKQSWAWILKLHSASHTSVIVIDICASGQRHQERHQDIRLMTVCSLFAQAKGCAE